MRRFKKRFDELRHRDLFHCSIPGEPPRYAFIRWEKVSSVKGIRYLAGVPEMRRFSPDDVVQWIVYPL